MVTVTVSTDCLALDGWPEGAVFAVVITSWPHLAGALAAGPPYCTCCWTGQLNALPRFAGTVAVIAKSPQPVARFSEVLPSGLTRATVPAAVPKLYLRVTVFALKGAVVAAGPE